MMQKWSLRPAPTAADGRRHVLYFQGNMKDVVLILQRFAAICGRPGRSSLESGFDYRLYINKPPPATLESLSSFLSEISPPPSPEAPVDGPQPAQPAALAAPAPEASVELGAQIAIEAGSSSAAFPAPERAAKPLWGIERGLDEKRNFDTLLVGSYNRFAHASATSVVGSPGAMYNPLFVYGGPGVGKTHMLNAIGNGLARVLSAENILFTSGMRLSSAATLALAAGSFSEIEGLVAQKKCLLIDDIHLLAASEANQGPLGKLIAHFLGQNLQVVITSPYPPRALAALEEALKISFAKGSAVEMKPPGVEPQRDITLAAFGRHGLDLSNDENAMFHDKLGSDFFEGLRWVRRLLAFKQLRESAGKGNQLGELIAELFAPAASAPGADMPSGKDLEEMKTFSSPIPGAKARPLAVFFPKGSDALCDWMIRRFYASASEIGASQDYRRVLADSYDPDQPFGEPFRMGELCRAAGAEGALILGPGPQSKLSERTAEFSHAVRHILADHDAAMGWIGYAATTAPVSYLHAHLDLAARWSLPPYE